MRAVAIIADIVKSRSLEDRVGAQHELLSVFRRVAERRHFVEQPWATVGDEFQAVVKDVRDALQVTAIVRLLLPKSLDCRFGLGEGEVSTLGQGPNGPIQDGPAWWSARDAVGEAKRREVKAHPYLRTWYVSDPSREQEAVVNAYLLVRDHVLSEMKPRERRLLAGGLLGRTQSEMAMEEGITQSAVSQSLRRSGGGAMLAAHEVLAGPL